jgi:hypothetical protein
MGLSWWTSFCSLPVSVTEQNQQGQQGEEEEWEAVEGSRCLMHWRTDWRAQLIESHQIPRQTRRPPSTCA